MLISKSSFWKPFFLVFLVFSRLTFPAEDGCSNIEVVMSSSGVKVDILRSESHDPRGVILLGHGLNNPASLMHELGRDLCQMGYTIVFLKLKGHDRKNPDQEIRHVQAEDWLEDAEVGLHFAQELAEKEEIPLHLVAYSLSALVLESYLNLNPNQVKVSSAVYLAPAIGLRARTHLLRFIPAPGRLLIPSLNRPDSRVNSGTSLAAYRALFKLRSRVLKTSFQESKFPHLLILNQGDEVVATKKTEKMLRKFSLDHWRLESVTKNPVAREHSHQHLFVSRESLGSESYTKMLRSIQNFLSSEPN